MSPNRHKTRDLKPSQNIAFHYCTVRPRSSRIQERGPLEVEAAFLCASKPLLSAILSYCAQDMGYALRRFIIRINAA